MKSFGYDTKESLESHIRSLQLKLGLIPKEQLVAPKANYINVPDEQLTSN